MRVGKRSKQVAAVLLSLILLASILLLFPSGKLQAESLDISFGGAEVTIDNEKYSYLPSSSLSGLTVNLNFGDREIDYWEVEVNGNKIKNGGTLSGNVLTLPDIKGIEKLVVNTTNTNPGHYIWRNAAGTHWQTQGERTAKYSFPGSCIENGVSECPGVFPSHLPYDLQYQGKAVTTAYEVESPSLYYLDENKMGNKDAKTIPVSAVVPESIRIIKEKSKNITDNVDILETGGVTEGAEPGKGMVRVAKLLDKENSKKGFDWDPIPSDTPIIPHTEGRNYKMEINAFWQGISYEYRGKVTVYLKPTEKPDLGSLDFKTLVDCIALNVETPFEFSFSNGGGVIDTPFTVQVWVAGQLHKTFNYPKMGTNKTITEKFTYTFTNERSTEFVIKLDPDNRIVEETKSNNEIKKLYAASRYCDDKPGEDKKITGDFDVVPSEITFRDSFKIIPKDIEVTGPGCTYVSHQFRITLNYSNMLPKSTNKTQPTEVTYPYPSNVGVGTNQVYMKIFTTCGESEWIGPKPIKILDNPNNRPPVFQIGWFQGGDFEGWKPNAHIVVKDSWVNLRVIQNPTTNPPEPYDPDGDPIEYYFHFEDSNSTWIRGLPDYYRFGPWNTEYNSMRATELGTHEIMATATDSQGASSTSKAMITVVEPNPIPMITAPDSVVEGRPVTPPITGEKSFTYVPGRTISRFDWGNRRDMYPTPGIETITLEVEDSSGLRSLPESKAVHKLLVKEDLPPIPKLAYNAIGLRNTPLAIKNESYSPDGDAIVINDLYVAYDANNDGKCNEADYRKISENGQTVNYTADKVGKYCLKVYAEEDWGKQATGYFSFEIVNQAPEVDFTPVGISTEPEPIESTVYPASEFMTNKWVNTSLDEASILKYWSAAPDGTLVTVPIIQDRPNNIADKTPEYLYEVLPISPEKITAGKAINMPIGWSRSFKLSYFLGGGKYIGENWESGSGSFEFSYHLVDTNGSAPKLLFKGIRPDLFVREDLGEILFYYEYHYGLEGNIDKFRRYYKKYKISELARGNTRPLDESEQVIERNNSTYEYRVIEGRALTFSDGSDPRRNSRMVKFNYDIKEIDRTNRKIYSYRYDDLTTPYKVENYTGIPAVRMEYEGQDGHPDHGPKFQNYSDFSAMDFKGNRYEILSEMVLLNPGYRYDSHLVRWDGNTGQPKIIYTFNDGTSMNTRIWNTGGNHRYVNLDRGFRWEEKWYFDTLTETMHRGEKQDASAFYLTGLNGIGVFRNPIRDPYDDELMGYIFELRDRKSQRVLGELPFRSGRYEDGNAQVLGGHIYFMDGKKLFSYTYDGEQPPDHNEWHTNGQLINSQMAPMTNGTIAWSQKIAYQEESYVPTGMSFRIQDHKNMYRVEATSSKLKLLKIVNGRKQVLREVTHFVPDNTWTGYKVDMRGSSLKVYENGVPVIEVTDSTFTRGTFGPYSVHDTVAFKGISSRMMPAGTDSDVNGYAIVDTTVTYDTTYSDFESDPKIADKTEWKTEHTNTTMFLDAGDGKSGLSAFHNSVRKTPVPVFDKVGMYRISYREMDDPHPNYRYPSNVFGKYRKYSDFDVKTLIVHRRPIANFTASVDNNNLVVWNERSYDPDRCYSFGNCQPAYAGNHGIYQKKYYYVTPSGHTVQGKLQRPTEQGVYTLGLAVADEYRAWSDWYEQDIVVKQPVAANRPPSATLTYPNGSKANPTYVPTLTPTIKWNQSDPDPGTVFELFDVQIKDEWGRIFLKRTGLVQNTTATSNQWTLDVPLEQGQKYEVQVRVADGQDYSLWSNVGWMITNRPPAAQMTVPDGTRDKPTMMETLRPTLQWRQTDPDPGTVFKAYQLQITDESGTIILDTGQKTQNTSNTSASWKVDRDLPPRQNMQVRVRVHDGHVWSPWSPQAWMMINRPPRADFNWSPKPVWEGDAVEVFSLATDPDNDPLSYEWLVVSPDGTRTSYDTPRFNAKWMEPGRVEVQLTVSDGLASDSITKTIIVQELTIQSEVHHTPKWLKNHEDRGHNTTEPPKDFYSGEVFVVQTESAPAPVKEASASLRAKGKDGTSIDITTRLEPEESGIRFHGELYDEQLGSLDGGLPTGLHSIRFKIIYENGVVKEEDVPIRIIGSVHQFVGVHRIQ